MLILFLSSLILFALAYRFYGRFLDRQFGISPSATTPAHSEYDGIDYVPAKTTVLAGHHFSSIAGAGPIVGPIIAVSFFGWLPAVIWIVLGSILIGGVHDYASLVISVRNKARSIAQVAKELMSPTAHRLYLVFIWFALVYVLTVFVDLTATTFTKDGGVASSSIMYIALALMLGFSVYRLNLPLAKLSMVFIPLVFLAVYLGQLAPLGNPSPVAHGDPKTTWTVILIFYCLAASITPVWVLLQPRDYLSSYLLIGSVIGGIVGIFLSPPALSTPAFLGFRANIGYLFPALFITIACGACSGFHSIVASGTTAKQLGNERAALPVAYGSMLMEGMLALIAVAAVVVAGGKMGSLAPTQVFAVGMGKFLDPLGIPNPLGTSFGLLALSTFLLTTLDTATRLARYIFEEFFEIWGLGAHVVASLATLALPLWLALTELKDAQGNVIPAWKAIWPVFGATNQLLGALALLTVAVWLKRTGRRYHFAAIPMAFMLAVTLLALAQLIGQYGASVIGIIAALLLALALVLIFEAVQAFGRTAETRAAPRAGEAGLPGGGKSS